MVKIDTPIGYPPDKDTRKYLSEYWTVAMGALDLGDFETFLSDHSQFLYDEAVKEIEKLGLKKESRLIQTGKEAELKGSIEQYQAIAENLRQSGDEYHASAFDTLIGEYIAERNKPRRATRAKPAPKPKPLEAFVPPIHPQSFVPSEKEAKPTDYITKLCKQSPMSHTDILKLVKSIPPPDIEVAIKIIKECPSDKLDEFDRFEIETLLQEKAAGITPPKPLTERELHKLLSPAAKPREKPETKIRTFREVSGKREKEEEKDERVLPFKAVEYEFHDINLQNAKLFLRDYQQYLPRILEVGLQAWLESHRTAFKFPLTTHNLSSLASALQYSIIQPEQKNVRVMVAVQFLSKHAPDILVRGLEKASGNFNWSTIYSYYKDTLKTELPPIEVFKKDVLTVTKGIKFEF